MIDVARYAVTRKHMNILEYLMKRFPAELNWNLILSLAMVKERASIDKEFLIFLDEIVNKGVTDLSDASKMALIFQKTDLIRYLLDKGADPIYALNYIGNQNNRDKYQEIAHMIRSEYLDK